MGVRGETTKGIRKKRSGVSVCGVEGGEGSPGRGWSEKTEKSRKSTDEGGNLASTRSREEGNEIVFSRERCSGRVEERFVTKRERG